MSLESAEQPDTVTRVGCAAHTLFVTRSILNEAFNKTHYIKTTNFARPNILLNLGSLRGKNANAKFENHEKYAENAHRYTILDLQGGKSSLISWGNNKPCYVIMSRI